MRKAKLKRNSDGLYNVVKCRLDINRHVIDNSLSGSVEVVSTKPLNIEHAYVEIIGYAKCKWKLDKTMCKGPRIFSKGTVFNGLQRFYYARKTLCTGKGEEPCELTGSRTFEFSLYWPTRLPGTWEGDHGSVEYSGKITIRVENDIHVYTHSQPITVRFRRPLQLEEHLIFEGRMDVQRTFSHTKSSEMIKVSVWLPLCGIAAGQSLPVLCTVDNHSHLHFGTLIFVLTRIDIYRSDDPIAMVKKVRTDVCRVGRVVNIHQGTYEYYAVLKTSKDCVPTNQFLDLTSCQVIYEVWVSVRGAFRRYRIFGYPNIDTPGIPVIIGTRPLRRFDVNEITAEIFKKMYEYNVPILVDELPEDVQQIIHKTDEELSPEAMENLERQLHENEKIASAVVKEDDFPTWMRKASIL